MSRQLFQESLVTQQGAGSLLASYTTAKSVINSQALRTLPTNWWEQLGQSMRITVAGAISNIATTPGTLTMQVMHGSTVVFSTGALQLNATAHATLPFLLEVWLTARSLGSGTAATLMGLARFTGVMGTLTAGQTDDANTPGAFLLPVTAPVVGTGFDSTVANVLDFWAGFSINNAGNGIRVDQFVAESLN